MRSTQPTRITISTLHRNLRFSRPVTSRLIRRTLSAEKANGWTIGVVFVNDGQMRRLNRKFLSHNRTTDVLSFGYEPASAKEGEIIVNLDQARRQAPKFQATYSAEVVRLIIHGLLHLLGYDDSPGRSYRTMKEKEDTYVAFYA